MRDVLQQALANGATIIDNTKDEAYYREQRRQRDADRLAEHVFIENVDKGQCSIDPETNNVRRRISFDFVYFQSEALLNERNEDHEENLKQRVADQLMKAMMAS